jgi:hypothetical protein
MKTKIIGISVMTLMIMSIILMPIVSADYIDQSQLNFNSASSIKEKFWAVQSFQPSHPILTKVAVYVRRIYENTTTDLQLLIRSSLSGSNLRNVSQPASNISLYFSEGWVTFDFSDLNVAINQTYYIILMTNGSTYDNCYDWGGSQEDLYLRGQTYLSSDFGITWKDFSMYIKDFCFKTYAYNNPPNQPSKPEGTKIGKINAEYIYNSITFDLEGDNVYYLWDWGDGSTSVWEGPYTSGVTCQATHNWNEKGDYSVKVKAKDIHGEESDWSDSLPIKMPYSFNPMQQFLDWLFERFPNAFPLLRQLMGY